MKKCSKCGRELPLSMFNKANWLLSGLRSDCKDCYSEMKKKYWAKQPKSEYAKRRERLAKQFLHGERECRVCGGIYPATNEHFSTVGSGTLDTTCRGCASLITKLWGENNPEKARALAVYGCANRYARKRQREPKWLSSDARMQILSIYAKARAMTVETGVKHHVDHIVPLVGKIVSGLHVPWNLQVITEHENCRKSNKWNC